MNDIMKIVKLLEKFSLLEKCVCKKKKKEKKEAKV